MGYGSAGSAVQACNSTPTKTKYSLSSTWGYSSAGRALEWHSRGQRFDPAYLHQLERVKKDLKRPFQVFFVSQSTKMGNFQFCRFCRKSGMKVESYFSSRNRRHSCALCGIKIPLSACLNARMFFGGACRICGRPFTRQENRKAA